MRLRISYFFEPLFSSIFLLLANLCYFYCSLFSIFAGIIDLLTLEKYQYSTDAKNVFTKSPLTEKSDGALWEGAKLERSKLIDALSGLDDYLANVVISSESLDDIKTVDVAKALRNVTLEQVNNYSVIFVL